MTKFFKQSFRAKDGFSSSRKKLILIVAVMALVIALASELPAIDLSRFSIKLSGGMNYVTGGDFNRFVERTKIDFSGGKEGNWSDLDKLNWGWEGNGEIYFSLTRRFAIGVGSGYILAYNSRNILSRYFRAYHPIVTYSYIYDTRISAVPLTLSASCKIVNSDKISLHVTAGGGYYFGRWDNTINFNYTYTSQQQDFSVETATAGALGFHGGLGFEFKLVKGLSLMVEGFGRYVKISGFEGDRTVPSSMSSDEKKFHAKLYYYYEWTYYPQFWETELGIVGRPVGSGVRNVREAVVDLSGAGLRVGCLIHL